MSAQVVKTGKQQNMGENGVPRIDNLNSTIQRNARGKKGYSTTSSKKKKDNNAEKLDIKLRKKSRHPYYNTTLTPMRSSTHRKKCRRTNTFNKHETGQNTT